MWWIPIAALATVLTAPALAADEPAEDCFATNPTRAILRRGGIVSTDRGDVAVRPGEAVDVIARCGEHRFVVRGAATFGSSGSLRLGVWTALMHGADVGLLATPLPLPGTITPP